MPDLEYANLRVLVLFVKITWDQLRDNEKTWYTTKESRRQSEAYGPFTVVFAGGETMLRNGQGVMFNVKQVAASVTFWRPAE